MKDLKFSTRDEFKREKIADNLIKLIKADFHTSPMVVNGQWGSGKSEFSHKLINKIKETEPEWITIYIDAFRYDHIEDPLVMLITQISSSLPKDSPEKKDFITKAIPVLKVLGKVFGKAGISWILKQKAEDIGDDLQEAIKDGSEDLIDKGIEKVFEDFEKEDEVLIAFKQSLEKIAESKKIIICIDELDRCRPSFALSLLEKVKHVFDIKNIEFLFMANIEQVEAMVRKQYGHTIDAEAYLTKFFPVNIKLPMDYIVHGSQYNGNSIKLLRQLASKNKILSKRFDNDEFIDIFFEDLFSRKKPSLRDVERFYRNISIFNSVAERPMTENTHWFYMQLYLIGIYIYTFSSSLTKKILEDDIKVSDIEEMIGMSIEEYNSDKNRRDATQEIFAFFLSTLSDAEIKKVIKIDVEIETLNHRVNGLFKGSNGMSRSKEERISIIKAVIKTMQLC